MKGKGPGASVRQSGIRVWRDLSLGRDEEPLEDEIARVNGYRILSLAKDIEKTTSLRSQFV